MNVPLAAPRSVLEHHRHRLRCSDGDGAGRATVYEQGHRHPHAVDHWGISSNPTPNHFRTN